MEKTYTDHQRGSRTHDNVDVCHFLSVRSILCKALPKTWNIGGLGV